MFCSSSPKEFAETTEETWTFPFELARMSCSLLRRVCNSRKHKVSEAEVPCQQPAAAARRRGRRPSTLEAGMKVQGLQREKVMPAAPLNARLVQTDLRKI